MSNGLEVEKFMSVKVTSEDDVYEVVGAANYLCKGLSFTDADKQSIFISLVEVTRNILDHAGGQGFCRCEVTDEGFLFTCVDKGPGISNIDEVLQGTYTSSQGLGLGLASVKRLMDQVDIISSTEGTKIIALKRERR